MKITKLEWRGVQVPLRSASPWPHGRPKDRYGLLLWIFTDEGFVGVGDASPVGPSSGDGISEVASLLHDLAPSALGMSPGSPTCWTNSSSGPAASWATANGACTKSRSMGPTIC